MSTIRPLRALAGSLLWILSGVLGLVGELLSVTVILLPLGIPLLYLARRLFKYSMMFFLPRGVRHPAQELGKSARRGGKGVADAVSVPALPSRKARKRARKAVTEPVKKTGRKARKKAAEKVGKGGRSLLDRRRTLL